MRGRLNHRANTWADSATKNAPISQTVAMRTKTKRAGERSEQPARAAEPRAVNSQEVQRKGCTFFCRQQTEGATSADRGGNVSRPRGQRQQTAGAASAGKGGRLQTKGGRSADRGASRKNMRPPTVRPSCITAPKNAKNMRTIVRPLERAERPLPPHSLNVISSLV